MCFIASVFQCSFLSFSSFHFNSFRIVSFRFCSFCFVFVQFQRNLTTLKSPTKALPVSSMQLPKWNGSFKQFYCSVQFKNWCVCARKDTFPLNQFDIKFEIFGDFFCSFHRFVSFGFGFDSTRPEQTFSN